MPRACTWGESALIAQCMATVWIVVARCAAATGLPFEPDDSFGERGRAWTDLGTSPPAQGLTSLADGSIVITSQGSVARFLADGQRDLAFGFAGHCLAQFVCLSGLGQAVQTPDGKFLLPAVAGLVGFDHEEPLRYVAIEGTPGARTCPAGTQPLYRAYNDSQGRAPNHRYMTDPVFLDRMIAQRWVMEGDTRTRVFACVPLQ